MTPREAMPFPSGPILKHINCFGRTPRTVDHVHRLPGARLVLANYSLLQHDFPFLREDRMPCALPYLAELEPEARKTEIHRLIDGWLVCHGGFISRHQHCQSELNEPITIDNEASQAIRLVNYGRALVLCLKTLRQLPQVEQLGFVPRDVEGLLDIKGIGLAPEVKYSRSAHRNGLLMLGEGLRELLFGAMLDRIFQHAGHRARTVPIYGLLDTGFHMIRENGDPVPAGLLIRRAHRRPRYRLGIKDPGSVSEKVGQELELLIRSYGLTTTGLDTNLTILLEDGLVRYKYGEGYLNFSRSAQEWIIELTHFVGKPIVLEGVNIQFTDGIQADPPEPRIVDLGSFWAKSHFHNPIVNLVASRPMRIGEIVQPDSKTFVQPHKTLALPEAFWGDSGPIWGYDRKDTGISYPMDTPSILCHGLACAFRRGEVDGRQIADRLRDMIAAATEHWPPP